MDDPAMTTPWFIRLAQAVAFVGFVWIAFTDGVIRALLSAGVVLAATTLVIFVAAVREAILRRYRG